MTLTDITGNSGKSETGHHSSGSRRHYYARFNQKLVAVVALPIVMVSAVNIVIDPYGFWPVFSSQGINHLKPRKDNSDRLYKAADVVRQQPDIVVLGSSRTKQAIDPEHPLLNQSSKDAYNLAINGPNMYEVRRHLEHFMANQSNPELVVLGVDFFMFNEDLDNQPSFSESRLGISRFSMEDIVSTTLSTDALQASWETFQESRKQPQTPRYDSGDGFAPNQNAEDGQREWRFEQSLKLYFKLHSEYKLSEQYLDEFNRIVELCQEHNVPLVVFISPAHATQWEAIRATDQWDTFETWKRQITAIHPVWDFSGYNSVTTEPIAEDMDYYTDNSHYSVLVGDWVTTRILQGDSSGVPEDFGSLIDDNNIEQHLAQIRADYDVWAGQNQEAIILGINHSSWPVSAL